MNVATELSSKFAKEKKIKAERPPKKKRLNSREKPNLI